MHFHIMLILFYLIIMCHPLNGNMCLLADSQHIGLRPGLYRIHQLARFSFSADSPTRISYPLVNTTSQEALEIYGNFVPINKEVSLMPSILKKKPEQRK